MSLARLRLPLLLYGILFVCLGLGMYSLGVLAVFPRYLLGLDEVLRPFSEWLVWYSGMPLTGGLALIAIDLLLLLENKRRRSGVRFEPVDDQQIVVALTAYNDEASIAEAVADFKSHPRVEQVIVVDNNSTDETTPRAKAAGAVVVHEEQQGYGRCVFRCFTEALARSEAPLVVLCEGDRTFRSYDLDKLLSYAPHADVVNGTRTVETLRQPDTQLTTFMFYGNLFVGKLLEAKYLGRGTVTDVGTTYKLCRREPLADLMPKLNPAVNFEFNAHFIDRVLHHDLVLVECPITFHPRVGESKGGNVNNLRAASVGLRMIRGIVFQW